jgi:hypothetical protein
VDVVQEMVDIFKGYLIRELETLNESKLNSNRKASFQSILTVSSTGGDQHGMPLDAETPWHDWHGQQRP